MEPMLLPEERLVSFLETLPGNVCFVSGEETARTDYMRWRGGRDHVSLRGPRPISPVKQFLFPMRELVASFWTEDGLDCESPSPMSIVGLRNCDLMALQHLDRIFLDGTWADPFYRMRREAAFLVSVDCLPPQQSCFCTAVGGMPYATSGFDCHLAPLASGYLVDAWSARGTEHMRAHASLFEAAGNERLDEVEERRREMIDHLISAHGELPSVESIEHCLEGTEHAPAWDSWAAECLECGACTAICPTCHCYYLYDSGYHGSASDQHEDIRRTRVWDSCLYAEYSRIAGPGIRYTPRPRLRSRLANRLLHKFVYAYQQQGSGGCVGCGRCDDACPGGLEIRSIIRSMGSPYVVE